MRLIAAAEASRDGLWYARGGLQLLTPEQALQFGIALGAVDKLVNLLLDQGAQAWVERFTRDS
jgi:hypothetical protein